MTKKTKPNHKSDSSDKSLSVPQNSKVSFDLKVRERTDYSEKQINVLKQMICKDTRCVFVDGLWGTSKSHLAILAALKLLATKKTDGFIFIRNPVESSSTGKSGFLPGGIDEKMAPYNAILFEKLNEFISEGDANRLIEEGRIECIPLGFIRGRSWSCKTIIVDEASSMTYDDLFLLLSRCGEFTKIFFLGDSENQNDIGSKSGFAKMFRQFSDEESKENGVFTFEFKDLADIVRSGFVRFVMKKLGKIKQ